MTAKVKVSATVSPDRLREAREVTGTESLSTLLDEALAALIERELERRWLDAQQDVGPASPADLPGEVPVDLSAIPWDDPT